MTRCIYVHCACTYVGMYVADMFFTQIVNGYLELLSQANGRCKTIISQTMTSIVNCVAVAQRFHLLSKVYTYSYMRALLTDLFILLYRRT